MEKRRETNVQHRTAAVAALEAYTTSEVCAQYKVKRRTLYKWKKQWEDHGTLESRPRTGRPRKLTTSDEERLLALFHETPTLTNREIGRIMGIGKSTVSDYLKRTNNNPTNDPTTEDIMDGGTTTNTISFICKDMTMEEINLVRRELEPLSFTSAFHVEIVPLPSSQPLSQPLSQPNPQDTSSSSSSSTRTHYSEEYRLEAVLATQEYPLTEVAEKYNVSQRTLCEWRKRWEETKSLKSKKIPGRPPNLTKQQQDHLLHLFEEHPYMTNEEAAQALGHTIQSSSVSNYLNRHGRRRKGKERI